MQTKMYAFKPFHSVFLHVSHILCDFFTFSCAKFQTLFLAAQNKITFRMSASRISKDTQCLLYAGILVSGMKILIGIDIETP